MDREVDPEADLGEDSGGTETEELAVTTQTETVMDNPPSLLQGRTMMGSRLPAEGDPRRTVHRGKVVPSEVEVGDSRMDPVRAVKDEAEDRSGVEEVLPVVVSSPFAQFDVARLIRKLHNSSTERCSSASGDYRLSA